MFKKFLSATKNKIKAPPHIKMNGGGAGMSSLEDDEEFEARKHEWQVINAVRSFVYNTSDSGFTGTLKTRKRWT